jgi:hypothetical protein
MSKDSMPTQPEGYSIISEEITYVNKVKIAEALNKDSDYNKIDFMLGTLKMFGVNEIQTVNLIDGNDSADKILDIIARNGMRYNIGLDKDDNVLFTKNVTEKTTDLSNN